ncbi:MAG: phosphoglucosamine mutase [Spirochaetia bacterium]|nr:phosphoglucosamine mutase [Spirochaetia bacterium]
MLNLKSRTLKFSVSGLRGLYPEDINPSNIPALAVSLHKSIKKGPIAIARDNRPTGFAISKLIEGVLLAAGREVYDLGVVPTPTIKSFINEKNLPGGIMISASHNPIEYNGFKFIGKDGFFFNEQENARLKSNLETLKLSDWGNKKTALQKSEYAESHAMENHINSAIKAVWGKAPSLKNLKVAIDPVGGCACGIIPALLNRLGVKFVSIHANVSSIFPRNPEPLPFALKDLGRLVVEEKCDIGFAYDPDADRLALVGPDGKPLGEELTLPLVLLKALPQKKGDIVVNLSSSWLNDFAASRFNRKTIRSAVGEANVVKKMLQKKAGFGGEGNGGVIDPAVSSFGRDSVSGTAYILSLLSENKNIYESINGFPKLKMKKTVIQTSNLNSLYDKLKKSLPDFKEDTTDGLRLSHKSGLPWVHLRPSNTEPVVRLIAEASTEADLKKIFTIFK